MAKYWIDPEKSTLALDANKLSSAVVKLWEEEADQLLKNNTVVDAINMYLNEENLMLVSDGLTIQTLNQEEWLTETNLSVLNELSGAFSHGTLLYCESDADFDLTLTADIDGELEEHII